VRSWIGWRLIGAVGLMRFAKDGEALLAAYSGGFLGAVGGITIDPWPRCAPDAALLCPLGFP
jgi:hypothetical protein